MEAEAAMAACLRRLEMLPRLVTEGRGEGGGMEAWAAYAAADEDGRE